MIHTYQKPHNIVLVTINVAIVITLWALLAFVLVPYFTQASTQTLFIIGTGGLLITFLIWPTKFLLGYLVAFPLLDQLTPFFTSGEEFGLRLGPQIVFRGGVIALLLYYWLANRRNPLAFKAARPIFIILSLFALITFSSGILVELGFVDLAKIAFWMILLLTVADLIARKKIKLKIIYQCVMYSILVSIASVLISEYFFNIKTLLSKYTVGEVTGVFTPHSFAISLSMGLAVVLVMAIKRQNKLFLLLLFLFSLVIIIIIMKTYVRTGYISFISMLFFLNLMLWFYGKGKDAKLQRSIIGVFSTIIIGITIVYIFTNIEKIERRLSDFEDITTAGAGRIIMYRTAFKTYADYSIFSKLFGNGLGVSFGYLPNRIYSTHNDYLKVLLSGGLVGMGLYFWLFVNLWKQIKPNVQNDYLPFIIAGCAIAVYLVSSMTAGVITYVSTMTYFSFLVGGAIGYYQRPRKRSNFGLS